MKIEVDIEALEDIDISGYLVCLCLMNEENNILELYAETHKIPTISFEKMVKNGYLEFTGKGNVYTLENIKLTDKFKEKFFPVKKSAIDFNFAWKQILIHYPNKVMNNGVPRYLHTDVDVAKEKYRRYIVKDGIVDEEEHSFVLQAINYLVNIKSKSNSLGFLQGISPYINQKNWNSVRDDVMKIILEKGSVEKNGDGKKGGFLEDV